MQKETAMPDTGQRPSEGASAAQAAAVKPDCRSGAALLQQAESVACAKASSSAGRTFILAVLAGMMIGAGASLMLCVKADGALSFAPSQILGGFCFSLGLICVIVAGAELFTGNTLMVAAAADKRIGVGRMLRNWGIVYGGNLVGSLLLVALMAASNVASMNGGAVGDAMVAVAYGKISLAPGEIFFRGILCNWLVCLAVWMGFAGRTVIDKVFTTIFPVMAFVACGFEHCVANMFILPMGIATLAVSGYGGALPPDAVAAALTAGGACYNIALATLGNIVGGAVFVGLFYWIAYRKKSC